MKHFVGFLLLQLAAALFARGRIAESLQRTEALHSYHDMIEQLRGLLESDGSPMPALLETLSERTEGEANEFVIGLSREMDRLGEDRFQNLWKRALSDHCRYLDGDIRRELASLGAVIGRYDPVTQLEAINACLEKLRRSLQERQRTQAQDTRVTLALSLSASLLAGILLI